jgi:hypothetical protein
MAWDFTRGVSVQYVCQTAELMVIRSHDRAFLYAGFKFLVT